MMNNEFAVEVYGTAWRVVEVQTDKVYHFGIYVTEEEAQQKAAFCNEIRRKLANKFERYETLPDNRCRYTFEFGSYVYGGSYKTAAQNEAGARGAVSQQRYNAYWATIGACDARRGA
jgi:hypothetical protein